MCPKGSPHIINFCLLNLYIVFQGHLLGEERGALGDITGDHDYVSGQKQNQNQIFKAEGNFLTIKSVQILKVIKLRLREVNWSFT